MDQPSTKGDGINGSNRTEMRILKWTDGGRNRQMDQPSTKAAVSRTDQGTGGNGSCIAMMSWTVMDLEVDRRWSRPRILIEQRRKRQPSNQGSPSAS